MLMTITIELPSEMNDWVEQKLQTKGFESAEQFVQEQLYRDWLEEKIDEATQEPATPMTAEDWKAAKRRLEEKILKGQ